MSQNTKLIDQIEAFCERNDMSVSTFGRKAVNDGKLVSRLQEGGSITMRTYEAIKTFMKRSNRKGAA